MGLFDRYIEETKTYISGISSKKKTYSDCSSTARAWPPGERGNIVLQSDTAVELGSPLTSSASFIFWTEDPAAVENGKVTIAGPDIGQIKKNPSPFAKIVFVQVQGFNESNTYERYREMEMLKFDINLKGYMMRAVSQEQREWSRISREAVKNGFSLAISGCSLINELLKKEYVKKAEIIYVTADEEDVLALKSVCDRAAEITRAMSKMSQEMELNCSSCEFTVICGSVQELSAMRKSLKNREEKI